MKKSSVLSFSIAIGFLLTIISCSKENITNPSPYRNEIAPGFADTPYLGTNTPTGDTPYVQIIPTFGPAADTPYLHGNYQQLKR